MIHEACDGDMTCKVKFRCENTETEVLGCGFRNKVGPPPSAGTRGCQNSFTFFAENTKITTKTTMVNKLYFSHTRTDIIYIKDI